MRACDREVVREVTASINNRELLAKLVGGEAALRELPHGGFAFPTVSMITAARRLAGREKAHNEIDMLPLLRYIMIDTSATKRYSVLGTPNCRADTHALLTCTALRMLFKEEFKSERDAAIVWHTVFAAERLRVLKANCRGARLVSNLSGSTNGVRGSFQYLNIRSTRRRRRPISSNVR